MKTKAITFYHILGVSPTVTDVEIRQAYIRLVQKYHPDRHTTDKKKAAHAFTLVYKAYMNLKTKPQRQAYNRYLQTAQQQRGDKMVVSSYGSNDNNSQRKSVLSDCSVVKAARIAREILWPFASPQTQSQTARG